MRLHYDCSKCPAYCCTYDEIPITEGDVRRLARHFALDTEVARKRFTKKSGENRILRHQKDAIFGSACMFLDTKTRRCTIYEARPGLCHDYPDQPHCGYYDFLKWERRHQGDSDFIPLENRMG
jgi:Fe-S-cluster containining protein